MGPPSLPPLYETLPGLLLYCNIKFSHEPVTPCHTPCYTPLPCPQDSLPLQYWEECSILVRCLLAYCRHHLEDSYSGSSSHVMTSYLFLSSYLEKEVAQVRPVDYCVDYWDLPGRLLNRICLVDYVYCLDC